MSTTAHHTVELTQIHNHLPSVADALHLRCTCGWTSSAPDEPAAQRLADKHVASGDPAPIPSVISPY
jgi:hypothetical protein